MNSSEEVAVDISLCVSAYLIRVTIFQPPCMGSKSHGFSLICGLFYWCCYCCCCCFGYVNKAPIWPVPSQITLSSTVQKQSEALNLIQCQCQSPHTSWNCYEKTPTTPHLEREKRKQRGTVFCTVKIYMMLHFFYSECKRLCAPVLHCVCVLVWKWIHLYS